jgi:hypothetical protein
MALAKPRASDPSLRGSWSLDGDTGTVARDRSSYKHHGTITDATWVKGRIGNALRFDGTGDRVVVPDSAALEPEHVSLALWFRATPYSDYHWAWKVLAYKGVINGWASSYSLKSSGDGSGLVFMLWDGSENVYTPPAPGVWDGEWHHAVGTYDGATIRLYVDGKLATERAWSGSITYGLKDGDQFIIGNPYVVKQRKQYQGDVDEVLVWDRALTAREVAKLAAPTGKKRPRK